MQQLSKFYSQSTRKKKELFTYSNVGLFTAVFTTLLFWKQKNRWMSYRYGDSTYLKDTQNIKIESRFFWPDRTIIILVSYLQWWASHLGDICNCVFNLKKKRWKINFNKKYHSNLLFCWITKFGSCHGLLLPVHLKFNCF